MSDVVDSPSSVLSKSLSDTSTRVLTVSRRRLLFAAFQGNIDFCPFTDKTGQCKLLPKHQLVKEWLSRRLQNASEHAWAREINTGYRQHVWTVSVQFKEYYRPGGRVSYQNDSPGRLPKQHLRDRHPSWLLAKSHRPKHLCGVQCASRKENFWQWVAFLSSMFNSSIISLHARPIC